MEGFVHSVQTLGTVDGPGVRCVVFLQGCPLRCICCHNPDTQSFSGGQPYHPSELADRLIRYKEYWGKNGGVTLSGGEPLSQAEFCNDLFSELRSRKIHTALDTSGCYIDNTVIKLLKKTDLVLLDHKYSTETQYHAYTGGSLSQTELFLQTCDELNVPVWLRRVIIPGLNDTYEDAIALRNLAQRYPCVQKIELLPFRKLCVSKYESLGRVFPLINTPEPSEELMKNLNRIISE